MLESNQMFGKSRGDISIVGCRFESNCPLAGPGTRSGVSSMGGLSKRFVYGNKLKCLKHLMQHGMSVMKMLLMWFMQ